MQTVYVLDFGAQYAQLIARRVRDLHVYSEVIPCDISAAELAALEPAALILSGGPASVYAEDAPTMDPAIFDLGVPILGLCYGQQVMALALGGEVGKTDVGEYGPARLTRGCASVLLTGTPDIQTVWMSHRDAVTRAPEGFMVTATTGACPVAAMENPQRRLYATQFHPEVRHTEAGQRILSNFLFAVAGLAPNWTMASFIEDKVAEIRETVREGRAICALSGGVDSAVCAALVHRAIGERLTCVFVDHGLLRAGEAEGVARVFGDAFGIPLVVVDAQRRYLDLLAGVADPEEKRRRIGGEFWKVFFEEAAKLGDVQFLAQGTIYPDIIESGARKTGGKAATIKSHHNLIPFPPGVSFELIEPLDHLFKDEVRELGEELGLPSELVWRQPFPGPGLAIRILGPVTSEKLELVRAADAIVREELDAYNARLFEETGERNSAHACWQYFAVLPDIKSVGVMGDERTYERPVILRAVESADAMTADWARLPHDVLAQISRRIVGEVPGLNRVVYDITSKPPATIEWE